VKRRQVTPRRFRPRGVFFDSATTAWLRTAVLSLSLSPSPFFSGLALAAEKAIIKAASGAPAQPLALKKLDGVTHDIAKLRGKVVLVNFWATWCEPCRDEMPSIEKLKAKLADQPFEVLAVNVDEPEARVRAFLEKTPLALTVVLDPGKAVTKSWNARILPASYLIGREGRVRYTVTGEIDWSSERATSMVNEMLKDIPRKK
jgi:cytochrome c biogenesis protein CcmG/thiol:disulfide interchange protein DsbE